MVISGDEDIQEDIQFEIKPTDYWIAKILLYYKDTNNLAVLNYAKSATNVEEDDDNDDGGLRPTSISKNARTFTQATSNNAPIQNNNIENASVKKQKSTTDGGSKKHKRNKNKTRKQKRKSKNKTIKRKKFLRHKRSQKHH